MSNEGYALLIGVDDYSAYDASVGHAKGRSSLLGSCNDVVAFFRTCRELDIAPDNIRVLTSPKLDPSALPGLLPENIGEATEQAILKGAAWLARAIGAGGAPGLMTFSGHGDRVEHAGGLALAICPSDVAGPRLERAISFEALRRVFAEQQALESLTCVIDACFAGASSAALAASTPQRRRLSSLTGRAAAISREGTSPPATSAGSGMQSFGDRVIAAAGPDQPAFQASFSGEHRGAFSWAVGAALGQWSRVREGSSTRLNLSYGELRARTERLLGSLSFEQTPVLHGPANVAELAFFQRGSVPLQTSPEPDAPRRSLQIDPGYLVWRRYVLTVESLPTVVLAEVFAMNTTAGSFLAGKEYWNVNKDALNNLGAVSVSIAYTEHSSGTPSPTSFTNGQSFIEPIALTWQTMSDDPVSGGALFELGNAYLRINDDAGSPASITTVTWYQVLRSSETPANLTPTGSFDPIEKVSVPSGDTGHYIEFNV